MSNLKCTECDREATFSSPLPYCDKHWTDWWVNGLGHSSPEAAQQEKGTMLKDLKKKYGDHSQEEQ